MSKSKKHKFQCLIPGLQEFLSKDMRTTSKPDEFMGIPGLASLEADHDPVTFPNEEVQSTPLVKGQIRNFNYQFIYRKGVRRITLQRVLLTKMIRFPGTITFLEVLCLYDNLLWCNAKRAVDPKFNEKFGVPLEVLTKILKEIRIGNRFRNLRKISERLKQEIPEKFLFPERNISSIMKSLRDAVYVLPGNTGKPNHTIPPRTFIGKGYRDHGCLKDTAWDGSPSWQEVASCHLDVLEANNADTGQTQESRQ